MDKKILLKEYKSNTWKQAEVTGVFKKTSIHKNFKQLTFADGFKEDVDFQNNVENWKPLNNDSEEDEADLTESYLLSTVLGKDVDDINHMFPVNTVPRREFGNIEVQNAMRDEIEKYRTFNAFEEVNNDGQDSLPVR